MIKALFLLLSLISANAHAETVYMKPSEALRIIFATSDEVIQDKKQLTPEQKSKIEKDSGSSFNKLDWTFFIAKTGGKIDGYAVVDNEIGKTDPITFLTAITPDGRVKEVEILVYRESHGGEVKEVAFRKQFRNKGSVDPIRVNQDIKNISGATLSSGAMSRGVKRGLLLWKTFYGHGK
jgi:thiamine biosynthesis lipoprotein